MPPTSIEDDQDRRDSTRLRPLFVLIVFVEAVTIAALYAFGRYFS